MFEENPEVKAVIARWLRAAGTADWATTANLFARSEGLRYIGTDFHEWWQGPEVATVFAAHMGSVPSFEIEIDPDEIEGYSDGTVGWGAARSHIRFGDAEPVAVRHTAVLALDAGYWQIVQAHNSVGVPNKDVTGVDLTSTLEELLRSMGDDTERRFRETFDQGTVTLVFTDIEDSTDLSSRLGDAIWADAIRWHDATIASIVADHGGTVVKSLGDGAMLAFESTRLAARAAITIQKAITADDAPVAFKIRIGIHIGDVVHTGDDFLGHTVNKAARIASSANGGQIVVSRAVHAMLAESSEFTFGSPTEAELKGIPGLHEITPLTWS
jgi:class 3 adenylate cyclase